MPFLPPNQQCQITEGNIAILPYETLMSAKQTINDKFQGSVATHLRCGEVVNNRIKKSLLLSLWWKKLKIGEYLANLQTRTLLFHALSPFFSSALAKCAKCKSLPLDHLIANVITYQFLHQILDITMKLWWEIRVRKIEFHVRQLFSKVSLFHWN